jgi:hypothetical protein
MAANHGYRVAYPIDLPQDGLTDIADGGAVSLGIDSKGNIWVLQRSATGTPQLSEFDTHYKLLRRVGDDIIGHQIKAHGITIDPQDNVWVCDAAGATIKVVSPEGKLVKTFGISGQRGDWDEAKGQRLLWQPLSVCLFSQWRCIHRRKPRERKSERCRFVACEQLWLRTRNPSRQEREVHQPVVW